MAKKAASNSKQSYTDVLESITQGNYATVYGLDGEEPYYTDLITNYIEHNILKPEERDFNLSIFYGKDAAWADVVSACRRYPMFADKQVVILKEAQQMKDLEKLLIYLEQPLQSTIFVIAHKYKKFDGRKALAKTIAKQGVLLTSDVLKEDQVKPWIQNLLKQKNIKASDIVLDTLVTYLGTDLQRIVNEIDKVLINAPNAKEITEDLVEKYIGISRDYNIFEWPDCIFKRDKDRTFRMLKYYLGNPKEAAMQLVIGTFFSKLQSLYVYHSIANKSDAEIASIIGMNPYAVKYTRANAAYYNYAKTEQALLMCKEYALKSVGIGSNSEVTSLLKEFIGRLYYL